MKNSGLSRREFIALGGSALALAGSISCQAARILGNGRLERRLGQIYEYIPQSARAIGHAYLEATPEEGTIDMIVSAIIQSNRAGRHGFDRKSDADILVSLKNQISEDFISDNVIQLNGWVLSRTEARLCAIYVWQL